MTTATATLARFDSRLAHTDEDLDSLRFKAVVGLVLLNALDLMLTRELLHMGGTEMNPLMALVIAGNWGIAIKLGLPAFVGYRHLKGPLKRTLVFGLCWMNVLYLGIVLWNAHLFAG